MKNIYFSICDYLLIKDIIDVANEYEDLHIAGFTTLVLEDTKKLHSLHVDVYVFQFRENIEECESFLAEVYKSTYFKDIQIFALLKELTIETLHLLMQYNIKDFLLEPIRVHHLMDALQLNKQEKSKSVSTTFDVDMMANRMMQEMGLAMHLSGFHYIKTCALLVSRRTRTSRFIVGHVYKECASIHNTTTQRVEKAIRTAITYAFRTQPEQICIYNDKPTNSQIILYLSEKLKQFTIV